MEPVIWTVLGVVVLVTAAFAFVAAIAMARAPYNKN
jgi:hypothetical protein